MTASQESLRDCSSLVILLGSNAWLYSYHLPPICGLICRVLCFTGKLAARTSFLCEEDMEEEDLLNDDAHIVPLACTLSPVFSSDREESCELQEMEALKHELISMQQHLDEMNNSFL